MKVGAIFTEAAKGILPLIANRFITSKVYIVILAMITTVRRHCHLINQVHCFCVIPA